MFFHREDREALKGVVRGRIQAFRIAAPLASTRRGLLAKGQRCHDGRTVLSVRAFAVVERARTRMMRSASSVKPAPKKSCRGVQESVPPALSAVSSVFEAAEDRATPAKDHPASTISTWSFRRSTGV